MTAFIEYKGYKIYPSTVANKVYEFVHKDYDGNEDNRCGSGKSIAEGGDLMYYCPIYAQKFISSTIAQFGTSAPLFAMQCYRLAR